MNKRRRSNSSKENHLGDDFLNSSSFKVFRGTIIHCRDLSDDGFKFIEDGLLGVDSEGKIVFLEELKSQNDFKKLKRIQDEAIQSLGSRKRLVKISNFFECYAGFIDTIFMPQYSFTGTGISLPLLEWLNKYTFPMESKFSDFILKYIQNSSRFILE